MRRKAQEEMVGFVLIVIILIAMGIIFLFLFKPRVEIKKDLQTQNLLNAILESTENGMKIREMIEMCSENNVNCDETEQAVKTRLNAALSGSGLVIGRTLQGYSLVASTPYGTSLNITKGNMTLSYMTAIAPLDNIDVILRFHY